MSYIMTGTVDVTFNSTLVSGTGTTWYADLQVGWIFRGPDGRIYPIESVGSDTEITLAIPYEGSTASTQAYVIFPTNALAFDLAASIQTLIGDFGSVKDNAGAGKFANGTLAAPGVRAIADPNTGIRWISADKFALVAGGVDQLIIENGQPVGGALAQSGPTDLTAGRVPLLGNDANFQNLSGTSTVGSGDNAIMKSVNNDAYFDSLQAGGKLYLRTRDAGDTAQVVGFAMTNEQYIGLGDNNPGARLVTARLGGGFTVPTLDALSTIVTHPGTASAGSGSAVSILSGNTGQSAVQFGDTEDCNAGYISYSHAADAMSFVVNTGLAARIDSYENFLVGKSIVGVSYSGVQMKASGEFGATCDSGPAGIFNRNVDDGQIAQFRQDNTIEGDISVSGGTVSLTGAHLSRWSQADGVILRGTVMTNLDDMCEWRGVKYMVPVLIEPARDYEPGQSYVPAIYDAEGNLVQPAIEASDPVAASDAVYADVEHRAEFFGSEPDGAAVQVVHEGETYTGTVFTEENEQLNRMAISSVTGDRNVAGVFQAWDTEDTYGDMLCAMTGDFVIRIGAGVTVARGDLLESAGDGTARPQADDLVRACTVAKVTSTHVSKTYPDGSYLVPCVLMAC